jgi:ATP-dependent helicase YprA (DUF1998 family)
VILIPDERPLDAYYSEHPDELFARVNEPLALNTRSRALAIWHYACALKEASRDLEVVAPECLPEPLRQVAEAHREGFDNQAFYNDDVHWHYNVRAGSDAPYEIVFEGQKIGEINRSQILRETPPNSIYIHDRIRYRVRSVQETRRQVRVARERSFNRTDAFVTVGVRIQQVWKVGKSTAVDVKVGRMLVSETLRSLTEKSRDGHMVKVFNGSQGLSANILPTTGFAVTVRQPVALMQAAGYVSEEESRIGWNGLSPLLRGLLPTVLGPCDLGDFGIHSQWTTAEASLYFYDQAYDGIDLTLPAADRIYELFAAAQSCVEECPCEEVCGCFRCVRDPFADVATSRSSTAMLLRSLTESLEHSPIRMEDLASPPERLALLEEHAKCQTCGKALDTTAKFCSNCGTKID